MWAPEENNLLDGANSCEPSNLTRPEIGNNNAACASANKRTQLKISYSTCVALRKSATEVLATQAEAKLSMPLN